MEILITIIKGLWGLLLLFAVMMYVVGPLVIWRLQRSPAKFEFLKLSDNSIVNMISPQCEQWDREIRQKRFRYVGSASMLMGNSQTYFSMYRHDDMLAMIVAMKGGTRNMIYAEFSTLHEDDSVTNTNNSPMVSVFPTSASKRTYHYPDIQSVPDLMALAKRIIQHKGKALPVKLVPEGKEFEMLEWFLTRESEGLVARGWYRPDIVDGYRKLTLRGAFFMSWRLLFPLRQIQQQKARQEALQLKKQVEK